MKNLLLTCFLCLFFTHVHSQQAHTPLFRQIKGFPGQTPRNDSFNIFFAVKDYHLNKADQLFLDSLVQLARINESVTITGYADQLGTDSINLFITKMRALTIAGCFLKAGFPKENIVDTGVGSIVDSLSADTNSLYRRVDIVLKKMYPTLTGILKLHANDTFELPEMYFEPDSHVLGSDSREVLNNLAKLMKANPKLKFRVEGHVCCYDNSWERRHNVPDLMDNMTNTYELSANRAREVVNYLVGKGIDKSRLSFIGYGGSRQKWTPEVTPMHMALNRRVVLRVLQR